MFDEIDWDVVTSSEHVVLVVPPVTLRELNKHKEIHSQVRVKKRAGTVIKKLHELALSSTSEITLRKGVQLLFEDREPLVDFSSHFLDKTIQDDQLIASAISFRQENTDADVQIITSDQGLLLLTKARRQNISGRSLPDTFKVPVEPDADEKRIKDLENQVRQFTDKLPKLTLTLGANQYQHLSISKQPPLSEAILQEKLIEMRKKHPPMGIVDADSSNSTLKALIYAASTMNFISSEDIQEYNSNLEEFYEEYKHYWKLQYEYQVALAHTVKIVLMLHNTGTIPAEDIDILLHFPDGFHLLKEHELPQPPSTPKAPRRPVSAMQKSIDQLNYLSQTPYISNIHTSSIHAPSPLPNVSSPKIRKTNSYDVSIHVQRIKHGMKLDMDAMFVVFDSFESAMSFGIDYKIHAGNLPNPVIGKLHMVVDKQEHSP